MPCVEYQPDSVLKLLNKMAATSANVSTCPFWVSPSNRWAHTSPAVKLREGRYYNHLLSAKTLAKRAKSKKKACPVCNKQFARDALPSIGSL